MSNFLLVGVCLVLGVILRQLDRIPRSAAGPLNVFVITISYPSLVLLQAPGLFKGLSFGAEILIPALMPWFFFAVSAVAMGLLGAALGWNRRVIGALSLTAGLGNTSFVGFPLLEAFYGKESLKTGIILDQGGTFLVTSTAGILLASYYADEKLSWRNSLHRVLFFPPFGALLISVVLFGAEVEIPLWLQPVLQRLADTLAPLALFSVGLQLSISRAKLATYWKPLVSGLVWKMVVAPALVLLLLKWLTFEWNAVFEITVIEAAMAPMITAAIIATDNNLEPPLANLMVGVGIPLSLITIPLWNYLI